MRAKAFSLKDIDWSVFGKNALSLLFMQKAVIAILLIMFIMSFYDTIFFSPLNFMNVFRAASPSLIIAFGVTLVVICRACDLSIGAVMANAGILVVMLLNAGVPLVLAIILAILSGTVVGFINGFLVVHQKTEAFIITLGMGILMRGVGLLLTDGNPIWYLDMTFMSIANGSLFSIGYIEVPNIMLFMFAIGIFTFWLLRFTSFGRNCYALGGDYEVAENSGINVVRTKWTAFVICGTYSAIAGVLLASRLASATVINGDPIPLMVNCGVVIGGTSFAGGIGGVGHSFIGIMVMQLLQNALTIQGINQFFQLLTMGIVIVFIICMDCYAIKRKKENV